MKNDAPLDIQVPMRDNEWEEESERIVVSRFDLKTHPKPACSPRFESKRAGRQGRTLIPQEAAKEIRRKKSNMTEVTEITTPQSGQKKIMLVEDDQFIADIYHIKLKEAGYEVSLANNGLDAVKKLEEGEIPDLMLLDIVMPYMDGRDVLRTMRENPVWENIPVILLTNISEKQQVEDAFKYGVKDYLIKSHFTPSEVIDKIRVVFEKMAAE